MPTADAGQAMTPKAPLHERAGDFIERHALLAGAGIAAIVAGALALTFWFTVFSGLSSSADFIYSQF